MLWQSTAKAHVDPVKSYLGVIQSFVPNKDEVSNLIKALNSGSTAEPSAPIVKTLVENVNKANAITSGFQMSDGVRKFLQKAKNGSATFADITPDVSAWIKEHSLRTIRLLVVMQYDPRQPYQAVLVQDKSAEYTGISALRYR